ncbi:hypothetical protein HHL11_09620 [Ramlibacter sp. G-1-2-2]|uniref:Uncharacterized protein n=1 Tax=Ramlibacter agri TaxID=2728837 RepID=A0A848H0M9_9BURK|nr:hypothetical protein [Ramlibacter agri]NML44007.1 hypothetical protein [Ramlibacter agri]
MMPFVSLRDLFSGTEILVAMAPALIIFAVCALLLKGKAHEGNGAQPSAQDAADTDLAL